jgi:hypothetical protein
MVLCDIVTEAFVDPISMLWYLSIEIKINKEAHHGCYRV